MKFFFYLPTYPIFFLTITGNKQLIILGLIRKKIYKEKSIYDYSSVIRKVQGDVNFSLIP